MATQAVSSKLRNQRGMTTAEYAVGTVATVSIVGVIIGFLNNPDFQHALWEVIKAIIALILQLIAGG